MSYYLKNYDNLVLTVENGFNISKIDNVSKTIKINLERFYEIELRNNNILLQAKNILNNNPLNYDVIIGFYSWTMTNKPDIEIISTPMLERYLIIMDKYKDTFSFTLTKQDILKQLEKNVLSKKERQKESYFFNRLRNGKKVKNIPEIRGRNFSSLIYNSVRIDDADYILKCINNVTNPVVGYYSDEMYTIATRHNNIALTKKLIEILESRLTDSYYGKLLKEVHGKLKDLIVVSKLFEE